MTALRRRSHVLLAGALLAALLAAALPMIRYWEQPSRRRLVVAGLVSALATAVKPGVAFLFLIMLLEPLTE